MTSKQNYILWYLGCDEFKKRREDYRLWILKQKTSLDQLTNHILELVWKEYGFTFWDMDFTAMRYYQQFTRECLQIWLDLNNKG